MGMNVIPFWIGFFGYNQILITIENLSRPFSPQIGAHMHIERCLSLATLQRVMMTTFKNYF
jgi:hypothetical protein